MVGSVAVLYSGNFLDAVFISRALMVSGVSQGLCCSSNATAPDTTGVAMLVPLKGSSRCARTEAGEWYTAEAGMTLPGYSAASVDPGASSESTRLPGATRSGFTVRSI